jgi:primosomal protein N' (replication factor Y)
MQTFTPYYEAIRLAVKHDYLGFFDFEIERRKRDRWPPVTRVVCVTVNGSHEEKAKFVAEAIAKELRKQTANLNVLMGSATPAPLAKVRNQYRYQVILRSAQILPLVEAVGKVMAATKMPDGVTANVDVDPISLL